MSRPRPYAKTVFEALDRRTYNTEEGAHTASREYLIRRKMREILIPKDSFPSYHGPEESLEWFLENRTAILDAYRVAVDCAAIDLARGTP